MKTLYFKSKALFLGLALTCSFGAVAQSGGGPVNDLCADATAITCGGANATGSTTDATNSDELSNVSGPGVWYVIAGDGSVVTVSTDNAGTDFDTRIGYTDACGNAGIDYDEDGGEDYVSGYTSVLTFATLIGTDYYIYVGGYSGTTTGNFELSVTCVTPPPTPANDSCENAIEVFCNDAISATTDGSSNAGAVSGIGNGVWYMYTGDNQTVTVATCSSTSNFDTEIAVFTGDCNNRIDIGSNDDACSPYSEIAFEAWAGLTYYIYVGHYNGSTTGDFDLTVTCAPLPVPTNDLCGDAIALECGDAMLGNTAGATATDEPDCTSGAPGVWFSFVGDGSDYTVSLDGSGYDTYLGITESCGGPCVASNDDISYPANLSSEISGFTTVNAQTYYIYVSGLSGSIYGESGTFVLNLTSSACAPPANDLCTGAQAVVCGDVVLGNTDFATTDPQITEDCDGNSTGNGLWYSFVGTGEDVTVSTCSANSTLDTEINLYSGSCGALVCEGWNDDDSDCPSSTLRSTLTFYATVGETYYVRVGYWSSSNYSSGDFELSVTCVCTADAGGSTADVTPVCMSGGSATITAIADGGQVVPADYEVIGVLADAAGNILDQGSLSYAVTAAGEYYIHIAVIHPADTTAYEAASTITDLHALTIDGGGALCGSIDGEGTLIVVNEEPTATMSGGGVSCDGAAVNVEIAFTGTAPWSVNYTDPVGVIDLTGVTDNPLVISSTSVGGFSINSTSDDNCLGIVSGSASITAGTTPEAGFSSVQTEGTLNVVFADTSTEDPTSWMWDFGDGDSSTDQNPAHTYAADGTYTVCLIASNACDADTVCSTVDVVPANDLCANAEVIACGGTATGSTSSATNTDEPDCVSGAGVWYTFAGTGDVVTFSTDNAGTDYDTRIGYTDTCGNACIDYDEDGGDDYVSGYTSVLTFATQIGTNYYVYVGGYQGTATGSYELTVTCTTPILPPANDLCANAEVIACGGTATGSTSAATNTDEPDCVPGAGVWYTFAGTGDVVTFSTDNAGTDYDTRIGYTDTCGNACLGYDDDGGVDYVSGWTSVLSFLTTIGTDYYVYVGGYSGTATGDFELTVTCSTPIPPAANDDCAGAIGLTVTETCEYTSGDVANTSESMSGCTGTAGDDVWYSFVAPGAEATVDVLGSGSFDAVLEVFEGACGTLVSDTCVDETLSGDLETVDLSGLTPGNTYFIRVYDYYIAAPATTTFDICVHSLLIGVNNDLASDLNLKVYPNPSNGEFVVELSGVEADVQINVMDVTGRMVYTEGANLNGNFRTNLNLDVASGSYLLQIASEQGVVTRKIQIQ